MTPRTREEVIELIGEPVLLALEQSGCVVLPREPTPDMLAGMEEMYMPMGEMIAAWDGACFANPFRSNADE